MGASCAKRATVSVSPGSVAMPVCSDDAVGGVFTVTLPLVGGEAPGLGPDEFRGWGLVEAAVLGCHLAALVGQLAHVRGVA